MDARTARSALIIAVEPAEAVGALRATLPIVGMTLVEYQVRQAIAAGAVQAIVLVATMPPQLLAALDRLRRDGVALEVARSIADAADRIHPDEAVLLIGDGCLASRAVLDRIAVEIAPALLVRAAGGDTAFERLGATHAWAGLGLVDGALVRRTASAPGDWDAQSTLLRRAMQAGAALIDAGVPPPRLVRSADPGSPIDPAMLAQSREEGGAWTRRWLFPLLDGPLVRLLGSRAVAPSWLALAAAVLGLLAAGLATGGLPEAGLAAFLISGPVLAVGRRLARLRLARIPYDHWLDRVRAGGGAAGLVAATSGLGDWGWLLAAAVTIGIMLASAREAGMIERTGGYVPAVAGDADGLAWVALAGWLAAGWSGGVTATTVYAILSFALVQDRAVRAL